MVAFSPEHAKQAQAEVWSAARSVVAFGVEVSPDADHVGVSMVWEPGGTWWKPWTWRRKGKWHVIVFSWKEL